MGWIDEIGPKTTDFLGDFGPAFLKNYGICLFLKLKAENDKKNVKEDTRKLKYREAQEPEKPKPAPLMEGDCWIRDGAGEGAFSAWAACYLVQQDDGNLAVYRSAKEAATKDPKKAKQVIRTAGYKLVQEVTAHFDSQAKAACEDLSCEAPEVGYSQHAWALTHPMRTNYIFQMHKGVGGGLCACLGKAKVEPADAGSEHADQAEKWVGVFRTCIANCSPRKLDTSVLAQAFERTVKSISVNSSALSGFSDDGTEGQILAHMIFTAVFEAACKPDALEQLKQAPMGRLSLWFRARGSAAVIIEKAVDASWSALQSKAEKETDRLIGKIGPLYDKIIETKKMLEDKLKTEVSAKLGEIVNRILSPVINEMKSGLLNPITNGVKAIVSLYEKEMAALLAGSASGGEPSAELLSALDKLPSDSGKLDATLQDCRNTLLVSLNKAKTFLAQLQIDCLKPTETEAKLRKTLADLLDAMVFTTVAELKAGGVKIDDVKADVADRARVDAEEVQKKFVSRFFIDLALGKLNEATKDSVQPALESAQAVIPEEIREIIDIQAEYQNLLEITIGAAIEAALYPPK